MSTNNPNQKLINEDRYNERLYKTKNDIQSSGNSEYRGSGSIGNYETCEKLAEQNNRNGLVDHSLVHADTWEKLKQYTDARIALGRAGSSIPTKPLLNFQLDHAEAKDAVLKALDIPLLKQHLSKLLRCNLMTLDSQSHTSNTDHETQQITSANNELDCDSSIEVIEVTSQASNKADYLKRPDWGRQLSEASSNKLNLLGKDKQYDVVIVMGDGLSARAIQENAPSLVIELLSLFKEQDWQVAPLVIATGSRVALGDKIAEKLNAKMLVMLIGERPGLSSPDSLGIYYTWNATSSSNDSMRNCISNVRTAGLPIKVSASRLMALMIKSKKIQMSGVGIKDEQETPILDQNKPTIQLL